MGQLWQEQGGFLGAATQSVLEALVNPPPRDGVGWRKMPAEPRGASQDV